MRPQSRGARSLVRRAVGPAVAAPLRAAGSGSSHRRPGDASAPVAIPPRRDGRRGGWSGQPRPASVRRHVGPTRVRRARMLCGIRVAMATPPSPWLLALASPSSPSAPPTHKVRAGLA